jgi:hypothetical protein
LKACGRFSVNVTTPRASLLRKTTGSSLAETVRSGAGSIDVEAFTDRDA